MSLARLALFLRKNRAGYLFASPWLIGFLGLTLVPMLASIMFSVTRWDGLNLSSIEWVGLDNYRRALWVQPTPLYGYTNPGEIITLVRCDEQGRPTGELEVPKLGMLTWRGATTIAGNHILQYRNQPGEPLIYVVVSPTDLASRFVLTSQSPDQMGDPLVYTALWNTAYYSLLSVPLGLAVALFLALLLDQHIRGIGIFRTIFYMPSVIGGVATMMMWLYIFDPDFGLLNTLLRSIYSTAVSWGLAGSGWEPPRWLMDPNWSKPALIVMSLWGAGGAMLIFLAALQNVPPQLYEAARIDGAQRRHLFRHVTLPQISPAIFFNLVMGVIASFQVFDTVYILTGGGPNNSTLFYVLYLYNKAFLDFEMGYASALAWILFVIIFLMTMLVVRSAKGWVYYEGER